jgi:hypothetical protein
VHFLLQGLGQGSPLGQLLLEPIMSLFSLRSAAGCAPLRYGATSPAGMGPVSTGTGASPSESPEVSARRRSRAVPRGHRAVAG